MEILSIEQMNQFLESQNPFVNELKQMKVGECLKIKFSEWPKKSCPSVYYKNIRLGFKITTKTIDGYYYIIKNN